MTIPKYQIIKCWTIILWSSQARKSSRIFQWDFNETSQDFTSSEATDCTNIIRHFHFNHTSWVLHCDSEMVETTYDAFQLCSYRYFEKKKKNQKEFSSSFLKAIVWIDYQLHFTSTLLMLQYLTVSLQQNHPCQDVLLYLRHCYCKLHRNVGGINMLPSLISCPRRRHGKRLRSPAVFLFQLWFQFGSRFSMCRISRPIGHLRDEREYNFAMRLKWITRCTGKSSLLNEEG